MFMYMVTFTHQIILVPEIYTPHTIFVWDQMSLLTTQSSNVDATPDGNVYATGVSDLDQLVD